MLSEVLEVPGPSETPHESPKSAPKKRRPGLYIGIALTVLVVVGVVGSIIYIHITGIRFFWVISDSMEPTLMEWDMVVVRRAENACEIQAGYPESEEPGDIIVFNDPRGGDIPIVHRAVKKIPEGDGGCYFKTKGDKSWYSGHTTSTDPWNVEETDIVGKVVIIIPNPFRLLANYTKSERS